MTLPTNKQALIFRFRVWLANLLVRMAIRIRPRELDQFMRSMTDAFIFGNGVMRVDPKEFFK